MISFVRSEEVDELHQLRAELAMTAALVESLRRSAGADPSPEGAVKLPLYKQFVRSRRERERVSLLPAAGGDGTEDWWIAAITAANSASLSRGGHLGLFPRRTKAGSSNTAYPRSGPRRQFSGFSPRRFGVFHDTNTLEVP